MLKVYPFGSGSEYTASYAVTSSYAPIADRLEYVYTASVAGTVQNPTSGSAASKNICLITYSQYLDLIANPGTKKEQCTFS